jgi:hypothetical protein
MAIELPRAGPGSTATGGRTRTVRLPGVEDIPTGPIARDPGLTIPNFAQFETGFGEFGAGLADFGESLQTAIRNQETQHDATRITETRLAFEKQMEDVNNRSILNDDRSDLNFLTNFEGTLEGLRDVALAGLEGNISDAGMVKATNTLQAALQKVLAKAGTSAVEAIQARAKDAAKAVTNQAQADAFDDPDNLDSILEKIAGDLEGLDPGQTTDQSQDRLLEARQDTIMSAVRGYVAQGNFAAAELLLSSGRFDEELTRKMVKSVESMIASGKTKAEALNEKAEEKRADAAMKKALDLDFDGKLTPDHVEGLRDILTTQDYKALLHLLKSERAGTDDNDTVIDLYDRLSRNEDISSYASEALLVGDLTSNTYRALMGLNKTMLIAVEADIRTAREDKEAVEAKDEKEAIERLKAEEEDIMISFATQHYLSSLPPTDGRPSVPPVTFEDIYAVKDKVSINNYNALISLLEPEADKATVNDPDAVIHLEDLVDQIDISDLAARYLTNGDITIEYFTSVTTRNRTEIRALGPDTPFNAGKAYISNTLNPSGLLSGTMHAIASAGQAKAIVEFGNWAAAKNKTGVGFSRTEALLEARAAVDRFAIINLNAMRQGIGLPTYYTGDRDRLHITIEDIDAAEKMTMDQFNANKISKAQLTTELLKLKDWRHIFVLEEITPEPAPGQTSDENQAKGGE